MLLSAQQMYDVICYGCDGLTEREDYMVTSMVSEGWTVNQIMAEVFEDREELFWRLAA